MNSELSSPWVGVHGTGCRFSVRDCGLLSFFTPDQPKKQQQAEAQVPVDIWQRFGSIHTSQSRFHVRPRKVRFKCLYWVKNCPSEGACPRGTSTRGQLHLVVSKQPVGRGLSLL